MTMIMLVPDLTDWSHQTVLLGNKMTMSNTIKIHPMRHKATVQRTQKIKHLRLKALPTHVQSIPTRGV